MEPLAVDVASAAKLLGLGQTTVYELLATGELPSFQVGRKRLFSVAALRQWVETKNARANGNPLDLTRSRTKRAI